MFLTLKDAGRALINCIIFFEGEPIFVTNVSGSDLSQVVEFIFLRKVQSFFSGSIVSTDMHKAVLDPATFSWSKFRLGYVNLTNGCAYVSRIPNRQWKVGLSSENLFNDVGVGYSSLYGQGLRDTLVGEFPSLDHCCTLLRQGKATKRAFARDLAISITHLGQLELSYKGTPVAFEYKDGFKLGSNLGFLKEVLSWKGVPLYA